MSRVVACVYVRAGALNKAPGRVYYVLKVAVDVRKKSWPLPYAAILRNPFLFLASELVAF